MQNLRDGQSNLHSKITQIQAKGLKEKRGVYNKIMNINLEKSREEKRLLLLTLYDYLEESFRAFELACKPGCALCCTSKLYTTSVEAEYLLEGLKERELSLVNAFNLYPRPKRTHNQLALLYYTGQEPAFEEEGPITACPFLTEEGLCSVYERRPLICRIQLSQSPCEVLGEAQIQPELYLMGIIALQIAENIDVSGLYGNLFDLLKFWNLYQREKSVEVPYYLLSPQTFEELPLLPEERALRKWVGELYRRKVRGEQSFRELLDELQVSFKEERPLSFLDELWKE